MIFKYIGGVGGFLSTYLGLGLQECYSCDARAIIPPLVAGVVGFVAGGVLDLYIDSKLKEKPLQTYPSEKISSNLETERAEKLLGDKLLVHTLEKEGLTEEYMKSKGLSFTKKGKDDKEDKYNFTYR